MPPPTLIDIGGPPMQCLLSFLPLTDQCRLALTSRSLSAIVKNNNKIVPVTFTLMKEVRNFLLDEVDDGYNKEKIAGMEAVLGAVNLEASQEKCTDDPADHYEHPGGGDCWHNVEGMPPLEAMGIRFGKAPVTPAELHELFEKGHILPSYYMNDRDVRREFALELETAKVSTKGSRCKLMEVVEGVPATIRDALYKLAKHEPQGRSPPRCWENGWGRFFTRYILHWIGLWRKQREGRSWGMFQECLRDCGNGWRSRSTSSGGVNHSMKKKKKEKKKTAAKKESYEMRNPFWNPIFQVQRNGFKPTSDSRGLHSTKAKAASPTMD
ncbi:hypothetical protein HDV00_010685 [Rhizophlyctis rosea]|nr:hypothetical protein HDV00_010685 [Rhizophlyctis rosea]